MNFDFTEDQLALRDLVRKFVEREMPKDAVAEWDAKGTFPEGLLDKMAKIGLMGASARAAHAAGGRVLGVMPGFLRSRERLFDDVETLIVPSMHERKTIMYDQSDAFVVAPGGVGTLEEVIEVLSWKRLDLHSKPVIFLNLNGFWEPLLAVMEHSIAEGMTPASFRQAWVVCDTVEAAIEAMQTADDMPRLQHDRR